MEILQGEPAMTIVPDLLISGILTVLVAVTFTFVAIRFGGHSRLGVSLIGLSAVMLLVGGGFGPPLLGVLLGFGAIRRTSRPRIGRISRALSKYWTWLLAAGVLGYLGLMPGTVLLSLVFDVDATPLAISLPFMAFVEAAAALLASRAQDARIT